MKVLSVLALAILLISCNNKKMDREAILKLKNDSIQHVADNLGAQLGFPSSISTSYQGKQYLKSNNKLLLTDYSITDIDKTDSIYMLSINLYDPDIFIDLTCDESQIKGLLSIIDENVLWGREYFVLCEINSIKKINYCISSEVEGGTFVDEEGNIDSDQTVTFNLDAADAFICKGKLLSLLHKN